MDFYVQQNRRIYRYFEVKNIQVLDMSGLSIISFSRIGYHGTVLYFRQPISCCIQQACLVIFCIPRQALITLYISEIQIVYHLFFGEQTHCYFVIFHHNFVLCFRNGFFQNGKMKSTRNALLGNFSSSDYIILCYYYFLFISFAIIVLLPISNTLTPNDSLINLFLSLKFY